MSSRMSAILLCRSYAAIQVSLLALFLAPTALAQLNWEGQTGGLLTAYAYSSESSSRGLGRPELAFHYADGGPALGDEFQASVTIGFLKIGEAGFTRSFNAQGSSPTLGPLFANGFNSFHVKFRLLSEGPHLAGFAPAIAAGAIVRTQVRRITEVKEGENTTCTDFYLVASKRIQVLRRIPVLLTAGEKLTNAVWLGLAANSPNWEFRAFGAVAFELTGPRKSHLTFGAEVIQEPRQFKEVPGPFFPTAASVPTTLAYFARMKPGENAHFQFELGVAQFGGNLGTNWNIQARHQITSGISYRF